MVVLARKTFCHLHLRRALACGAVMPAFADEALKISAQSAVMSRCHRRRGKRVLTFYVPENGGCAVSAVVWDIDANTGTSPYSSSRVRMELNPGQSMKLDAVQSAGRNVACYAARR